MTSGTAALARLFTAAFLGLGLLTTMVGHGQAQTAVDKAQILATNEAFYETFRNGDLEGMRNVWSSTREVGMTPPGQQFIRGREGIMGLFELMMARPPEISCEMEGTVQFRDGNAIIICDEQLGDGNSVRMLNVFVPEQDDDERKWKMIYHGPVPPNWQETGM